MGQKDKAPKKQQKKKKEVSEKKWGGDRSGSGPRKNPDAQYTVENSRPIRMRKALATRGGRQAIEKTFDLLTAYGKDFDWLCLEFEKHGLEILMNTYPRLRQTFRLYNTAAAATFNLISDQDAEAGGYEEVDIMEELMQGADPETTFLVKVKGNSMTDAGIKPGDRLIVKSINYPIQKPVSGDIIVASANGQITVKIFREVNQKAYLVPKNDDLQPQEITDEMNFSVYGIVQDLWRPFTKRYLT